MRCPKCNSLLADNINFCNYCGTPLREITESIIVNSQDINNNDNIPPTEDEELLKAYVGENYETIKRKEFNVFSFFLGDFYYLYRKAYSFFFLNIVLCALSFLFSSLGSFLFLIYRIYMAVKFNEFYLKKSEEKIKKIKQENPDKTHNELIEICKKKGGTSIIGPSLYIGFYLLTFIIAIVLLIISGSYINNNYTPGINEAYEYRLEDLKYDTPSGFKQTINGEYIKEYSYDGDFIITVEYEYNYQNLSGKEALEEYNFDNNIISEEKINNTVWYTYYNEKLTEYVYCTTYKYKTYFIYFTDYTSEDYSHTLGDALKYSFINSLTFDNNDNQASADTI